MPTNLPPDYFNAERRFREGETPAEKIVLLEEMISIVPKHKGTDHLRADLRRQLSRLREEAQSQKKHGGHASVYHIEREGAGQVALIGPTNVGKSALVCSLTNARPEVSPAPYTTWKPSPGMMPFQDIQIQLIDTPALERNMSEPGLFDLVRKADLTCLVVDLQADPLEQVKDSLQLLAEHHIYSQEWIDRPTDDARRIFIQLFILVNKADEPALDELYEICCDLLDEPIVHLPVSSISGRNFDEFKHYIYNHLGIIRVYAKPYGKEPDLERPFVLRKGGTVIDMARKVHRDFYEHLKSARVWGSAEFDGQMVHRDYVLQDGDIVELKG
jgi:uncharacterized protein